MFSGRFVLAQLRARSAALRCDASRSAATDRGARRAPRRSDLSAARLGGLPRSRARASEPIASRGAAVGHTRRRGESAMVESEEARADVELAARVGICGPRSGAGKTTMARNRSAAISVQTLRSGGRRCLRSTVSGWCCAIFGSGRIRRDCPRPADGDGADRARGKAPVSARAALSVTRRERSLQPRFGASLTLSPRTRLASSTSARSASRVTPSSLRRAACERGGGDAADEAERRRLVRVEFDLQELETRERVRSFASCAAKCRKWVVTIVCGSIAES